MNADVLTVLQPTYPGRVISSVCVRPYDYASSFHLDELTVVLADGTRDQLILKDFDQARMLPDARAHRPMEPGDACREIDAYRRILAPAGIGPRLQAAVADAGTRRFWLITEKVPGAELWQIGDLAIWDGVCRWLAEMHAVFSVKIDDVLAGGAAIPVLDEAWFRGGVARALSALAASMNERASGLRSVLTGWDPSVELAQMDRTFIHGELYPSNIIVVGEANRLRVCPVDWETAAVGPALLDLAALTSGWDEQTRARLVGAYGLGDGWQRGLQLCRLHLALRCLAWSSAWQAPAEHRQDWVALALQLAEELRS